MTRRQKADKSGPPEGARFEWERALRMLNLPSTTKLVGLMLATYANGDDGREAHPGEDRLAADCCLSTRAVRTHLATLRMAGLIERTRRGNANQHARIADVYALAIPDNVTEKVALTRNHPALGATRNRNDGAGTDPDPQPVDNVALAEARFRQQRAAMQAATGT